MPRLRLRVREAPPIDAVYHLSAAFPICEGFLNGEENRKRG